MSEQQTNETATIRPLPGRPYSCGHEYMDYPNVYRWRHHGSDSQPSDETRIIPIWKRPGPAISLLIAIVVLATLLHH